MLPIITFRTTTGEAVTTHDFGSVDAGSYKPDSSGWEVRIYNDYAAAGSEDATSVRVNVRGSTGGTDEVWCEQHWVEVKSYGCSTGITDDAMTTFQPVGTNSPLGIGDISSENYRTLFIRVNSPTDAEEQNVALQLICTYQNPQSSITKWITGLRGNGIVASTGDPFAMSTTGGTASLPREGGYSLIDNNEVYYGSSGSYDISTTGSGAYTIYLDESGTFGETTGTTAVNELPLYEATISSGVCTALADKRVYLASIQAGTTGAMPLNPNLGALFFDITNGQIYGAKSAGSWSLIST